MQTRKRRFQIPIAHSGEVFIHRLVELHRRNDRLQLQLIFLDDQILQFKAGLPDDVISWVPASSRSTRSKVSFAWLDFASEVARSNAPSLHGYTSKMFLNRFMESLSRKSRRCRSTAMETQSVRS